MTWVRVSDRARGRQNRALNSNQCALRAIWRPGAFATRPPAIRMSAAPFLMRCSGHCSCPATLLVQPVLYGHASETNVASDPEVRYIALFYKAINCTGVTTQVVGQIPDRPHLLSLGNREHLSHRLCVTLMHCLRRPRLIALRTGYIGRRRLRVGHFSTRTWLYTESDYSNTEPLTDARRCLHGRTLRLRVLPITGLKPY